MNDQVIIRTPIPTPEQMADSLGVSRGRLEELRAILREQGSIGPAKSRSPRQTSRQKSAASASTAKTSSDPIS
jgi:hypothetical protein